MSARTRASSAGMGGLGDYFYLVEQDGVNARVYNNRGVQVHGPEVPSTEINWALANLTGGRTWKEKVVVKGNFTQNAKIIVPSYTILDLTNAKLTLPNGVNDHMIQNSDIAGGNTDIEVIGGMLDGNGANQAGAVNGINFYKANRSEVRNVAVRNCRNINIYLGYSSYCLIYGCKCSDAVLQHGIMVEDHVYHNTIENNICYDNGNHGISLESFADYNEIIGNICYGNVKGILLEVTPCMYNNIMGNICDANFHGIQVFGSTGNYVRFCNFIGNQCSYNKEFGIYFQEYISHCNIVGNVCVGNSTATDNVRDDIYLGANCDYNNIQGNLCRAGIIANDPRYGINIAAATCDQNLVIDNDVYNDGFGTAPINDAGTGTILDGNRGDVGFYQTADYGVAWAGWPAGVTGVARNGTRCIFYNTNGAGAHRLGCYSNGAWHYVDLT